jgi:hypothetical protein
MKLCGYHYSAGRLRKANDSTSIRRVLRALHHRIVDVQKKPPTKAQEFTDAQGAIDATLDAWLPSLIEANDSLIAALTRMRDLYLTGTAVPGADAILAEVEAALEKGTKTRRGF